jgi:hypothetical protein
MTLLTGSGDARNVPYSGLLQRQETHPQILIDPTSNLFETRVAQYYPPGNESRKARTTHKGDKSYPVHLYECAKCGVITDVTR